MILSPILTALCGPVIAPESAPRGRYVEARTASVFAGACHYGSERMLDGREALLAWQFEAGSMGGVECAGLALAIAIADDENLADGGAARRSVVYVAAAATAEQRAALVTWLCREHAALVGDVRALRVVDLALHIDDEAFALRAPGVFTLAGDGLADRACCKMPFQVWYAPLVALEDPLVGHELEFALREPALERTWSRPGENAAFFGRFGPATPSRTR